MLDLKAKLQAAQQRLAASENALKIVLADNKDREVHQAALVNQISGQVQTYQELIGELENAPVAGKKGKHESRQH